LTDPLGSPIILPFVFEGTSFQVKLFPGDSPMRIRIPSLAVALVVVALAGLGCNTIRAKAALKDGNKAYKDENFKQAIEHYQRVVELVPDNAAAHFYLASSHQALYRPGKTDDPANRERLDTAIAEYKKALEAATGEDPNDKILSNNALSALTAIYADEPFKDYDTAVSYADRLVKQNPDDIKNLFAMANLYERFNQIQLAEQTYSRAWELNPSDVKACGALAAFYNKPLWEGRSRFDEAIGVLERCASLSPDDPTGFYKVSTFYWDKAYRDPMLTDQQKDEYADKGLTAVERALTLKSDYIDAIVYKGLLLRVKAAITTDRRRAFQLLEEAQALQKLALDLKKQEQQEQEAASEAAAAEAE
jgi:tetratricopeptide (TPR) repeat protein